MKREQAVRGVIENLHDLHRVLFRPCTTRAGQRSPLSRAQTGVLMTLAQDDRLGVKELAELFGISSSAITQIVDGLAADKCIVRKMDTDDRRKILLRITARGKKKLEQVQQCRLVYAEQLLEHIPTKQLQALSSVQQEILAFLR